MDKINEQYNEEETKLAISLNKYYENGDFDPDCCSIIFRMLRKHKKVKEMNNFFKKHKNPTCDDVMKKFLIIC